MSATLLGSEAVDLDVADDTDHPNADRVSAQVLPSPSGRQFVLRGAAVMLFVLAASALVQLFLVSRIEHTASQQRLHDRFRGALATGTAPIGPLDGNGRPIATGTPVAYLEIPSIRLKETVVEGTSASNMYSGSGHRRDTPLPGQVGTSVVFGRRTLFGGPFAGLTKLAPGAEFTVTTGQGVFRYRVTDVRREGDPVPESLRSGHSRLQLATAGGGVFSPDGVLWVDADLLGDAVGGPARLLTSATLPGEEQAGMSDSRTLWALVLWLQLLLVAIVAALWSWRRWGRAQAWIVFTPVLLLVSTLVWDEFFRLLPNLV